MIFAVEMCSVSGLRGLLKGGGANDGEAIRIILSLQESNLGKKFLSKELIGLECSGGYKQRNVLRTSLPRPNSIVCISSVDFSQQLHKTKLRPPP